MTEATRSGETSSHRRPLARLRCPLVAAALFASTSLTATAAPTTSVTLPLTLHIATRAGKPVVDEGFISDRLARANQIFAPYNVQFTVKAREPLAEAHAAMETRADRDKLGTYFKRGTIHVFFVESLRDVDEPERMRRGVHWHSTTYPGAHYVIVSSIAGVDVPAHELGHYLGNPEHSETPGNLMSYEHTEVLPFLDDAQRAKLARKLKTYLSTKELKPVLAPR